MCLARVSRPMAWEMELTSSREKERAVDMTAGKTVTLHGQRRLSGGLGWAAGAWG